MQQVEIKQYLKRFFQANHCPVLEEGSGYFTVQLTVEMDKELMNRPFYWHYLEKTGGDPQPMKLSFITNSKMTPNHINGEKIHFGSPRLHQIFQTAKKIGGFIRLYEQCEITQGHLPLHPWIGVNLTVSYICDKKKDELFSLGLHLISGTIIEDFQQKLNTITLTPKIPDYCFTMSPIIKPKSGLKRIEQYVVDKINQQEHDWANDAVQRMNRDLMLLNHFYEPMDEKPAIYWNEKEALRTLYEPHINIQIQNGGIFYLSSHKIWENT
ncbi:YqhG family protein [Bacillus sp. FJAT-47783]|uniref:YqhG family protein n=1 Tax=Bacillus sp. FJAT-47783 TaxID=2922712 RepID=UPI001FACC4E5|nr:YqhG family protein [Bacillus sp. FJAT-47783]